MDCIYSGLIYAETWKNHDILLEKYSRQKEPHAKVLR